MILPRYDSQFERFKKRFGNRIIIPEHVIDAVPLIQAASVFVGGGGTMTAEAALLGIPAISYYPGEPTFVDRFLTTYGLVERLHDPGRIAQHALAISRSREFQNSTERRLRDWLGVWKIHCRLLLSGFSSSSLSACDSSPEVSICDFLPDKKPDYDDCSRDEHS